MKVKTKHLNGKTLDWAVLTCIYEDWRVVDYALNVEKRSPSTNFLEGGEIIDKMMCLFEHVNVDGKDQWKCILHSPNIEQVGDTILEAAMRGFVASKLGEELYVPRNLV